MAEVAQKTMLNTFFNLVYCQDEPVSKQHSQAGCLQCTDGYPIAHPSPAQTLLQTKASSARSPAIIWLLTN